MRHFSFLLLLAFVGFSLPAHAQEGFSTKISTKKTTRKQTQVRPAAATAKKEAGPVLTFERTPCFGICPGYLMQVYTDGRVAYEGRRAVPIMGKKNLRLPAAAVADMLRQANEAHFDQFQDRYSLNTSDLPSTIIAVRQPNGQLKTVVVEEGEPDNVRMFVTHLAKQFDALAQLGGVDK